MGGVQLSNIFGMPVDAQRIRLAACTVNWGVRGIEGAILEMPVIGASWT